MAIDGVLLKHLLAVLGCSFGAFVLYMLNKLGNNKTLSLFAVLNINVDRKTGHPAVILIDMIVSSLIGGIIVYILAAPVTGAQEVAAGLGMSGLLSVHIKGTDDENKGNGDAKAA